MVTHLPKGFFFFFLKIEGASGFQTPSEDSLEYYACHKQVWQKMRNYTKQPQVKKYETCIRHKNIYFRILLIKRQYGSQRK